MVISVNGGSSWNYIITVFDNYSASNPFFWNWYILPGEFIEVITFTEKIDLWKWLMLRNNI